MKGGGHANGDEFYPVNPVWADIGKSLMILGGGERTKDDELIYQLEFNLSKNK